VTSSIFGVATSALTAARAALTTTTHNIANVHTEGYTRQRVLLTTPMPSFTGAGFIGAGVSVETVRRLYSEVLEVQRRDAASQAAGAAMLARQLAALDDLLADPLAGLAPALVGFFEAVHAVAASPADPAARQAFLARSAALATRFRDLDARLVALRDSANRRLEAAAASVNAYAVEVAQLNRRILESGSQSGQTHAPNDLLDRRDALLAQIGRYAAVSAVAQPDGTLNLFLSSGQALVVGGQAYALEVFRDPESPEDYAVGLRTGAVTLALRSADIAGGEIAGLVEFRDDALAQARRALGRIAVSLAAEVNAQHRLGLDLHGEPGGELYAVGAPRAVARASNAGDAQLAASVAVPSALRPSAYRLTWDGAAWQIVRLADGASWSAAALPQTVDGVEIALAAGTPAAGDSFRIEPTLDAAGTFALRLSEAARVAAAVPVRAASRAANAGSAAVATLEVLASPGGGFPGRLTLRMTAPGAFDLYDGPTFVGSATYVEGEPLTLAFAGWSVRLTLRGTPAAGDELYLDPNTNANADGGNFLALARLQERRVLDGATATWAQAWSETVSAVGNRTQEALIRADSSARLAEQARAAREAVSGVNLDEEAANLLRYQQAYQAAAKALAVSAALFERLLELGG